jgi:hypothetical protein
VTLYIPVGFKGSLEGIYRPSLQVKRISQTPLFAFFMFAYCLTYSSALKMKAVPSSKTLLTTIRLRGVVC